MLIIFVITSYSIHYTKLYDLVRTLPREQQKKALTYGIVGAFVFRFLALVFAAHLMGMWVFKLIGA